jgi:hypothetical protein
MDISAEVFSTHKGTRASRLRHPTLLLIGTQMIRRRHHERGPPPFTKPSALMCHPLCDNGDKQAADYAPTQVDQRLGSGSMETKCEASLI